MCNRIRGLKEWSEIPRSLTRSLINFEYNPNVAPTEQVPAFLAERGKPLATRMARFGISLASSGGKRRPPLLNARTDSLRRGSFKTMLANKRCVIPAEGFYEWREEHGKKQPYFFARKDGRPVMFARIWDYSDVKGEAVPSFAILTDEPNELVAPPLMGHSNDLIAVCQEKMKISPKQIWSCLLPKHVMAVDGALAATRPMNYD
jgi:putative SOS response-associated peptidase YedK